MKIQSLDTGFNIYHQNRNNTAVNFTSFAYKPGAKLSIRNFNPLKLHMNKFFERSLLISRLRFQELSPELTPYTHEVSVGKSYAWDINKDNRKKYLMVLHGAGQNISNLQSLYKEVINKTSFAVFAPEYSGFGKNPPSIISAMSLDNDTDAALKYLTEKKKVNHKDIYVMGHSLGGFIATQLVQKNNDIGRMILVCPLESLRNRSVNYNIASGRNSSKFTTYLFKHFGFLMNSLNKTVRTDYFIKKINVPTDIIHAKNDSILNYSSSKNLALNCKNLNGLYLPDSGGHGMDISKIDIITSLLSRN